MIRQRARLHRQRECDYFRPPNPSKSTCPPIHPAPDGGWRHLPGYLPANQEVSSGAHRATDSANPVLHDVKQAFDD